MPLEIVVISDQSPFTSVARLGDSCKLLATNFLTKLAQILAIIQATVKSITLLVKTAVSPFWALFGIFRLIWSHWSSQPTGRRHLIVQFGFVVLQPLHLPVHVCEHFFVHFKPALKLDSLLHGVDDLEKAFTVF